MPYPHDLLCPTDPWKPKYVGFCERCSRKVYHEALSFQYDYRGNSLVNLGILVCPECYDRPNELLRPIIVGPDSLPPRPRPTASFYEQQMAGTGLTASPSPETQLLVLGDEALT